MAEIKVEETKEEETSYTITGTNQPPSDPDIPDGGYGWVVVAGIFIVNGWAWGVVSSYSVFLAHYLSANTFPGTSPLEYSFVGGTNFAAAMIVAPLVNVLIRNFGTRTSMLLGTFFISGGLIAASFAKQFWSLIITQGIMVGIGVGLLYVSTVPVVSQWFLKRRSFAQGLTAGGTGIGGLIFSSSITPMITNISLAWSLRIMGIICFVMLFLASCMVRDRNKSVRPRLHPFDIRFFRRWDIWLLMIWGFLFLLGYMTLISSLPDFARSLGISQSKSSITAVLINLTTTSGRTLAGWASDHYGRITVALICTFASGIFCLVVWVPSESLAPTLVFAFLVGNVYSVFWISIAPIAAEIVGLQELPSLLAIAWLNAAAPCFVSEAIALELRRPNSDRPYLYPQIYAGLSYIVGGLFLLELRRIKIGLFSVEKHR